MLRAPLKASLLRFALVAGFAAGLAGCSSVGNAVGGLTEERFGACPTATILADAADVTSFRPGPGRDLPDVHYQGHLADLETECSYGRSRGTRYAWARLNFNVEVDLGSAAYPSSVTVPYFVVVVVPETQTVLTKEVFSVDVPFNEGARSITVADHIGRISIPVVENTDGANYEIIIGFELTPEQVEFNRARGY